MRKDAERGDSSGANLNESQKPGEGKERIYFAHGASTDEIVDRLEEMRERMLVKYREYKAAGAK